MTTILIAKTESGYHVKLKSDDPHAFRLSIDTLKSCVPASFRSYNPTTREWFVDDEAAGRFRQWLDYCRANLYAEIEWLDGEDSEDPESEWTPPARPKAVDPYQTLHLLPSAPLEVVKAVPGAGRAESPGQGRRHERDAMNQRRLQDVGRVTPAGACIEKLKNKSMSRELEARRGHVLRN